MSDNRLYPLKFKPIAKTTLWGGSNLKQLFHKDAPDSTGETWEISTVPQNLSVVENGFLADNDLQELAEIYMGDLLGDKVFSKFGTMFPLLIKFIDAADDLSIQVHPNDELAQKRHNSFGKTEMWHVVYVDPKVENPSLYVGFKPEASKESYLQALENKSFANLLNKIPVKAGDTFYIPAGRVHAIGKGIVLAEIQQTSDITYRIYDWDRVDKNGKARELHTELALDAIDFSHVDEYKSQYTPAMNASTELVSSPYFQTNLITTSKALQTEYENIDSFVIYICTQGEAVLQYAENEHIHIHQGETVLIPNVISSVTIVPTTPKVDILEVYIP